MARLLEFVRAMPLLTPVMACQPNMPLACHATQVGGVKAPKKADITPLSRDDFRPNQNKRCYRGRAWKNLNQRDQRVCWPQSFYLPRRCAGDTWRDT